MENFTRTSCDTFPDYYLAIQRARLTNHLKRNEWSATAAQNALNQLSRIQRRLEAPHVPMVVAVLPDENQVNPALRRRLLPGNAGAAYDFAMPQSMLTEMLAHAGIPAIDLLPTFLADQRCLYMNDTHWTPEGHVLAATALADGLAPWLPGGAAGHNAPINNERR